MNEESPFSAKLSHTLLSILGISFIFYMGRGILVPILLAFLFAIVLRPLALFLKTRLRFPHVIATMLAVLLFVLLIVGLVLFISFQISDIASDFDKIQKNINIHIGNIEFFIKENFHLSKGEQRKYLNAATDTSMQTGTTIIGTSIQSFTDVVLNLTLIPIYTFLILLYRTHFILFLSKLFKEEDQLVLQDILYQIKVAVKSYIVGLLLEMIAVTVLTTIGLSIIGVQYAILMGIVTGILNLIPYIGILFAGFLTIVVSLTGTTDVSIIIGVIAVNVVVQLIDNNILVPIIVNSKVEINAFVSIVGIIIGGSIAGISGMFLAIPIIAILKVVFDRIEHLKPWGYFMGDDLPKTYEWHKIKLPSYSSENPTGDANLSARIPKPPFTATQTTPPDAESKSSQ